MSVENIQHLQKKAREYYWKDPIRAKEYQEQYRKLHKDKLRETQRKSYLKNKKKRQEYYKKYYLEKKLQKQKEQGQGMVLAYASSK